MIVDAGTLQAFAGGQQVFFRERLAAELLVVRGPLRPGAAPFVVGCN